jgi:hypothetical protein
MDEEQKHDEEEQNQSLTVSNPFARITGSLKSKIEELIKKIKEPQNALPPGKTPTTREIKVVQSNQDVFSMMGGNPLKKLIDRITSARMSKASSKDEIDNKATLVEDGKYQVGNDELKSLEDADVIIPNMPKNPIIATPEMVDSQKDGIVIEEIGEGMFEKPKEQETRREKKSVNIEAGTIGEESREEIEDTRENDK